MPNMLEKLDGVNVWIDDHADELIDTLTQLVRIPSVVGNEQSAQAFVRERYLDACLDVDEFEPQRELLREHPAFVDSGFPFAGRANVVGVLHGTGGGRSLILNGHTDVVSPEPLNAWSYDPWGAKIVPTSSGRLMFGRGTLDMKSGLIANLFALRAIAECGIRLRGDLILQSVIEEEAGGGGGTLACFERGYLADGFIATEPHWRDICVAHPGVLYFRVVVEGKSAHAGRAHLGHNAAVELASIVSMFGEWDQERALEKHFDLFERPDPQAKRSCHLNVGVVRAGDWPSTVPGRAECEVRMSFIPGETEASVKAEIAARVNAVAQKSAWLKDHPPKIEYFGWHTEPWLQDERHAFVQTFASVFNTENAGFIEKENRFGAAFVSRWGETPKIMGNTSAMDTRFAALYGTPSLAWGPKGANMHGANESVELDSVIETSRVLAKFAMIWCG
jgi:acetylornithine deacetylase